MPEISVVVVTYNSELYIKECLDSVLRQPFGEGDIVVVDNNSRDRTAELIKSLYPRILLIENPENMGAAYARNQGIGRSQGTWVLTLDCDVVLKDDFLSGMDGTLRSAGRSAGMIQPKVLRYGTNEIYTCGIRLGWSRRFFDIGMGCADSGKFDTVMNILGPCSAASFYRRDMLEEVKDGYGYFDQRFFFLVEDVDLAWRASRKGWKTLYCPDAVCYHRGNSSASSKKMRQYLCFCNRYYSILKNEGLAAYLLKVLPFFCYDLPRYLYLLLTNGYMYKGARTSCL